MTTNHSSAAVRICAIADAECSRSCGAGACKREAPSTTDKSRADALTEALIRKIATQYCEYNAEGRTYNILRYECAEDFFNCVRELLAAPVEQHEAAPAPMLLFCPNCGTQHIDRPEIEPGRLISSGPNTGRAAPPRVTWDNPPHRSHLCHACGCTWRPADFPTAGIAELETRGKNDNWDGPGAVAAQPVKRNAQPEPPEADDRAAQMAHDLRCAGVAGTKAGDLLHNAAAMIESLAAHGSSPTAPVDERAAFEARAKTKSMDLTPFETTFDSDFTSNAWDGWQAARASSPNAVGAEGTEAVAWVWCDTIHSEHCHSTDAEAIEEGWVPLVYGDPKAVQVADERRSKIKSAIKATEYKYFGSYEFTEAQHDAVDVLVEAARTLLAAPHIAPPPPAPASAPVGLTDTQREDVDVAIQVLRQVEAGEGTFVGQCADAISGLEAILEGAKQ